MKIKPLGALAGLILVLSFLAGCGAGQNATPTTDPKAIYTQVAEQAAGTAAAQQTNIAKLTPQATSTPQPTDTPAASPTVGTPNPTTAGTQATANPTAAGTAGTGQPTTVVLPTNTKQAAAVPDKLLYISQSPADGTVFKPGDKFTMTWKLQNVGTTTWDNTYRIRLYGGERFGVQDFALSATVKPQSTINITAEMTAPSKTGQFNSIWVLTNPDGANFGYFTFNCEVK